MTLRLTRRNGACAVFLALALIAGSYAASGVAARGASGSLGETNTQAGRTVVYGQTQGISQLDPNTIASGAAEQLLTLLWNGLTKWSPNMRAVPDLATSWVHSKDYRVWTFKLRSGVRFANGRTFTARDAVQNIMRVLDPTVTSQAQADISSIQHAKAVNKTTLRLQLKEPDPTLPDALTAVKMTDVPKIRSINTSPNGTGPYTLKSFVPGQLVDLVRNPHYFGPKPQIPEIKIVTYSDISAAEAALRAGNLDLLWDVPPTQVPNVAASAHAAVLQAKQPSGAFVLEVDTTSPPFNNPVVRRALSYAVDRSTILKLGYENFGVASTTNNIVSPKNDFYAPNLTHYAKNLALAKRLFAQAGVTSLTYSTIPSAIAPQFATAGQVIQQDLASIGIQMKIEEKDVNTWVQGFYPRGKHYPGVIIPNTLSFPPLPSDAALRWFAGSGNCECNWLPGAAYDSAAATARTTPNDKARANAYVKMQQLISKDVPVVVVVNSALVSVAQPSLKGVWVQSDGTLHLEKAFLGGK